MVQPIPMLLAIPLVVSVPPLLLNTSRLADLHQLEVLSSRKYFRRARKSMLTIYSDLALRTKDRVAWAKWAKDLVCAAHRTIDVT